MGGSEKNKGAAEVSAPIEPKRSTPPASSDLKAFNHLQMVRSLQALILRQMVERMQSDGLTVAAVAARVRRKPAEIRALLVGHRPLRLDDVSDLLLAISASELRLEPKAGA